jgi:HSP20 family protein
MQHYHWNPMRELAEAQRQFSLFFDNVQPGVFRQHNNHHSVWTPAVDVYETQAGYEFVVELPGVKPEAVDIEVKDNTLMVKGERPSITLKEGERFHHHERPAGRFARSFRLSKPVDADGVSATYRDGILFVSIPLRAEAKPRKITVRG